MLRHIVLVSALTAVAVAAGVAMVPGEREQWTMLVRDGRNEEALRVLEARYNAGKRETDAVVHLYKLYMSFAEVEKATRVVSAFAAERPNDPEAVALLAKHYGDVQDRPAETQALERLFALSPSAATARSLLTYYRLEGAAEREETLLRSLLASQTITASDAERLGLMLAAREDWFGARDALLRFDDIANPERSLGRLALFDVLVRVGDRATAMNRGAGWLALWRGGNPQRGSGSAAAAARLTRMMMAVDPTVARTLACGPRRPSVHLGEDDDPCAEGEAAVAADDVTADPGPRGQMGRRRRR
jgi:hypothetical protein